MAVTGIDHVNIVTRDLAATVDFFSAVLGLEERESPAAMIGLAGAWMVDPAGWAIIHIVVFDQGFHGDRHAVPAADTGPLDHVALRCEGFAAMREKLTALGLEHKANDRQMAGLRQIFVPDPNGVVIELNFYGD